MLDSLKTIFGIIGLTIVVAFVAPPIMFAIIMDFQHGISSFQHGVFNGIMIWTVYIYLAYAVLFKLHVNFYQDENGNVTTKRPRKK